MTNDSIKVLGLADDRLRGGRVSDDTLIALAGRPDTFHPRFERDRRTSARISQGGDYRLFKRTRKLASGRAN